MAKSKTSSTTTLLLHKASWNKNIGSIYGTISKGIYGNTTF